MPTPKQPSKILELRGAFKRNPQRKPKAEPQPTGPVDPKPKYLSAAEQRVYIEICEACAPGVLTSADTLVVAAAARLEWEWRRTGADMASAKIGQLMKCLATLGMTPADRARISVEQQQPDNEWDGV
jgi:hypothetical protein